MNNTFNINRFILLLNKDIQENGKRYLFSFLSLLGTLAIILISSSYLAYSSRSFNPAQLNNDQLNIISSLFFFLSLAWASTAMDVINTKTKRISYLSMPASNFEKYFSRWLIVTIGYFIAFFISLWIADLLRVLIGSILFREVDIKMLDFSHLINSDKLYFTLSVYFLFQSIFLLGSMFWEKNPFIKTFSFTAIIIGLLILLMYKTIGIFYDDYSNFGNVIMSFLPEELNFENRIFIIISSIAYCFTLINWILAFFRFKEFEIIKRW